MFYLNQTSTIKKREKSDLREKQINFCVSKFFNTLQLERVKFE